VCVCCCWIKNATGLRCEDSGAFAAPEIVLLPCCRARVIGLGMAPKDVSDDDDDDEEE